MVESRLRAEILVIDGSLIASVAGLVAWEARRRKWVAPWKADADGRGRFEAIVEHGSDLLVLTTIAGKVTYVSPTLTRVLGFEVAALDTGGLEQAIHPKDRDVLPPLLQQALATGRASPADVRLRHADGGWRTVEMTVVDLTKVAEVGGILWTSRDVTDRRDLEDELAQAAVDAAHRGEKLAEAQRLASLGSWEWDEDLEQLTWSAELFGLLGFGPDFEPTPERVLERVHPEDREALTEAGAGCERPAWRCSTRSKSLNSVDSGGPSIPRAPASSCGNRHPAVRCECDSLYRSRVGRSSTGAEAAMTKNTHAATTNGARTP